MLTESPSDDTRVQPSCATRVYFNEASTRNEATDKAIPPTGGKTPLEAAMAAANTYVETLHKKLRPFLTDLIRQVLKDASVSHFKSEKLKEINATSEYVPAICRTVGMKLQAVSEVTKSTGFKALEDELAETILATRREWATRFVLPVFDMNVKALRRRFQLSFCRLLSSAAKGFIAQVGIEGYDAIVAIMDLLSIHGDEVLAPFNVTTHDFLVLLKEATGTTIIPSPTVEHSLSEALHKINGTSPLEDRGQEDGGSTTTNAAHAAAAAAAITVNEQLTAAKSAVAQATSHLELMRELVNQARAIDGESTRTRMAAHERPSTPSMSLLPTNHSALQSSTPLTWIRRRQPKVSWQPARKRSSKPRLAPTPMPSTLSTPCANARPMRMHWTMQRVPSEPMGRRRRRARCRHSPPPPRWR